MPSLFESLCVGDLELPNRMVMAPLTRMRSTQPGNIPNEINALYYSQRASAGLIISEATQVCQQGQGYPGTPGIHSPEQVAGWRLVTHTVHKAGGRIFLQLWHVGRISHSSHQAGNALPVAPSAIKPSGAAFTADWKQTAFETPRALELAEIPEIISHFSQGAQNARDAGFDGVEVHSANGYLLDQFLQDGTNKRADCYGGSVQNRAKLLLEVVDAATAVWGSQRVGVRLSPYGTFNDMSDSNTESLFSYVITQLGLRKIAYIHLIEPRASDSGSKDSLNSAAPDAAKIFRGLFSGVLISAGGYTPETAVRAVEDLTADAIAFGRWFISNPDLPERIRKGAPLNPYDRSTFYGGGEKGYTDYPSLTIPA